MALSQVVGIPPLFDLCVVHGGVSVITFSTYSVNFVQTFPNRIYLLGVFSAGSDKGFSQD